MDAMKSLYTVIQTRKDKPQESSYTCYLFNKGLDKILKKLGEESAETIIAAKNNLDGPVVEEVSDLLYHVMVMLVARNIPWQKVEEELNKRADKIGNLKPMRETDKKT